MEMLLYSPPAGKKLNYINYICLYTTIPQGIAGPELSSGDLKIICRRPLTIPFSSLRSISGNQTKVVSNHGWLSVIMTAVSSFSTFQ
jgi:hypothetical protein